MKVLPEHEVQFAFTANAVYQGVLAALCTVLSVVFLVPGALGLFLQLTAESRGGFRNDTWLGLCLLSTIMGVGFMIGRSTLLPAKPKAIAEEPAGDEAPPRKLSWLEREPRS